MKAIVKTGGKQYVVAEGQTLCVEKIDAEAGSTVELNEVLLVNDGSKTTVGSPTVANAKVKCTVVEQTRAPKVIVYKYKRRKDYHKKRGHRQPNTILKVEKIEA